MGRLLLGEGIRYFAGAMRFSAAPERSSPSGPSMVVAAFSANICPTVHIPYVVVVVVAAAASVAAAAGAGGVAVAGVAAVVVDLPSEVRTTWIPYHAQKG